MRPCKASVYQRFREINTNFELGIIRITRTVSRSLLPQTLRPKERNRAFHVFRFLRRAPLAALDEIKRMENC